MHFHVCSKYHVDDAGSKGIALLQGQGQKGCSFSMIKTSRPPIQPLLNPRPDHLSWHPSNEVALWALQGEKGGGAVMVLLGRDIVVEDLTRGRGAW